MTPQGVVKVLDFGLAKLAEAPGSGLRAAGGDMSLSPTITSPALMTGVGALLGTAAYMAPEQARGKPADKRADIWAFGCVLYEMLAGTRAFDGEDVAVVLASIIKGEPDWTALPADVPAPIVTLLHGCLEKDPRSRIADISTAIFVLTRPTQLVERADVTNTVTRPEALKGGSPWRRGTLVAAAAGAGALLTGSAVWMLTRPPPPRVMVSAITTSGPTALVQQGGDRNIAITPDGSRVVYRGDNQLLVRALDQLEPTVLSGLRAPRGVFTSPDSQSIGFFDGSFDTQTLKKVSITGGPPMMLTPVDGPPRGATWGPDRTIIFATDAPATGLQQVSDSGGEPTVLTTANREQGEGDHRFPEFLPSGRAVLFTITATGGLDNFHIAVLDLATGKYKRLIQGSHAHYVPTGHLVYGVGGTLRAVRFDVDRLEVIGTPAPVRDGVVTTFLGAADAVTANGSLVYVPGSAGRAGRQTVVAVDRDGRPSPLPGVPLNSYRDVRVSPRGERVALATQDDLWVYDSARESMSKLTNDPGTETSPLWTRDGERIVFTSNRAGYPQLFSRHADTTGDDELVLEVAKDLRDLRANGWSKDGKHLLFTQVPLGPAEIAQFTPGTPPTTRLLLKSGGTVTDDNATVSPDGSWMAYQSSRSGRTEIYVERYPELGDRLPISMGGGRLPVWSRDGRELSFMSLDNRQMLVVPMQTGKTLVAGRPQVLFDFPFVPIQGGSRPYDVAPDGRFLIIRSGEADAAAAAAPQIILVQNWFEELKRLLPTN